MSLLLSILRKRVLARPIITLTCFTPDNRPAVKIWAPWVNE